MPSPQFVQVVLSDEEGAIRRADIAKRLSKSTSSSISRIFDWLHFKLPNMAPVVRRAGIVVLAFDCRSCNSFTKPLWTRMETTLR